MADSRLEGVTKVHADGTEAVSALDLEIADGEFVALVGPSGCGKTSVLRMVAGLEEVSGGFVHIGGRTVNHLLLKDRDIAMVFQNYAPGHLFVAEFIGSPGRGVAPDVAFVGLSAAKPVHAKESRSASR